MITEKPPLAILICEDCESVGLQIGAVQRMITDSTLIVLTTTVEGIRKALTDNNSTFNVLYLDGYLDNGETTLEFLRELTEYAYGELVNLEIVLISGDDRMLEKQLTVLYGNRIPKVLPKWQLIDDLVGRIR